MHKTTLGCHSVQIRLFYHGQVIALMLSMPQALKSIQTAVAMCLNGKSTATAVLAGTTP